MNNEIELMDVATLVEFINYLVDNFDASDDISALLKNFYNAYEMQDFEGLYYYGMAIYYGKDIADEWLAGNQVPEDTLQEQKAKCDFFLENLNK